MNKNIIIIIIIIIILLILLVPILFKNKLLFSTTSSENTPDTIDEGEDLTPNYQSQEDINLGNALAQSNMIYVRNKDLFTTFRYDSFEKIFYNLISFIDLYFPQLNDTEHKNFLTSYIFLNSSLLSSISKKIEDKYNSNKLYYSLVNEIILDNMSLINSKNIITKQLLHHSNFSNNDEEIKEYIKYKLRRIVGFNHERDYSIDEIAKVITVDLSRSSMFGGSNDEIKMDDFNYTVKIINYNGNREPRTLIKNAINERRGYNYFYRQRKRLIWERNGAINLSGGAGIDGTVNIRNDIEIKYEKYIREKQEDFDKYLLENDFSQEIIYQKQLEFDKEIQQIRLNKEIELDSAWKGRQSFRQDNRGYQQQRLLIQRYFESELDKLNSEQLSNIDKYNINISQLQEKFMNIYNFTDNDLINLYLFDQLVDDIKDDFFTRYRLDISNIRDDLIVLQYYNLDKEIVEGYYANVVDKSEHFINTDKFKMKYLNYLKEFLEIITSLFKVKNTTNENIHKLNLIGFNIINNIIYNIENSPLYLFWDYTTQDGFSFFKSYDSNILYDDNVNVSSYFTSYEVYLSNVNDDFTVEHINELGNVKHILNEYVLYDTITFKYILNKYINSDLSKTSDLFTVGTTSTVTPTVTTTEILQPPPTIPTTSQITSDIIFDSNILNAIDMFFKFQKYSTTEFRNLVYQFYNNKINFISIYTLLHYMIDMTVNSDLLSNFENSFDFLLESRETTTSFNDICSVDKCNRLLGNCKNIIYLYRNNKEGLTKIKKCLDTELKEKTASQRAEIKHLKRERRKQRLILAFSIIGAILGLSILSPIFIPILQLPLVGGLVAGVYFGARAIEKSIVEKYNKKTLAEVLQKSFTITDMVFIYDNLSLLLIRTEDGFTDPETGVPNAKSTLDNYNFKLGDFDRLQSIVNEIIETNKVEQFKSSLYNIFMSELFNSHNVKRNTIITLLWTELLNGRSNYYKSLEYDIHSPSLGIVKKQELFREVISEIETTLGIICEDINSFGLCNVVDDENAFENKELSVNGKIKALEQQITDEKLKMNELKKLATCCITNIQTRCKNFCNNLPNNVNPFKHSSESSYNNNGKDKCKFTCEKYGEYFFKDEYKDLTIETTTPVSKDFILNNTLISINNCKHNKKYTDYTNCITTEFNNKYLGVCGKCMDNEYNTLYYDLTISYNRNMLKNRCYLDCSSNKQLCKSNDENCNNFNKLYDTLNEEDQNKFIDYSNINSLRETLKEYSEKNPDSGDIYNQYNQQIVAYLKSPDELEEYQKLLIDGLQRTSVAERYMNKIKKCTKICSLSSYYKKFPDSNGTYYERIKCFDFCKKLPHTEHISEITDDNKFKNIMTYLPGKCNTLCKSSNYNKYLHACNTKCRSIILEDYDFNQMIIDANESDSNGVNTTLGNKVINLDKIKQIKLCTNKCDKNLYNKMFTSKKACFNSCLQEDYDKIVYDTTSKIASENPLDLTDDKCNLNNINETSNDCYLIDRLNRYVNYTGADIDDNYVKITNSNNYKKVREGGIVNIDRYRDFMMNDNVKPRTALGKNKFCYLFCSVSSIYEKFRGAIASTKQSECRKRCIANFDSGFFDKYKLCNQKCKKEYYYGQFSADTIRNNKIHCNNVCYTYDNITKPTDVDCSSINPHTNSINFECVVKSCRTDIYTHELHRGISGINQKDKLRKDCNSSPENHRTYLTDIRPVLVMKKSCLSSCNNETSYGKLYGGGIAYRIPNCKTECHRHYNVGKPGMGGFYLVRDFCYSQCKKYDSMYIGTNKENRCREDCYTKLDDFKTRLLPILKQRYECDPLCKSSERQKAFDVDAYTNCKRFCGNHNKETTMNLYRMRHYCASGGGRTGCKFNSSGENKYGKFTSDRNQGFLHKFCCIKGKTGKRRYAYPRDDNELLNYCQDNYSYTKCKNLGMF